MSEEIPVGGEDMGRIARSVRHTERHSPYYVPPLEGTSGLGGVKITNVCTLQSLSPATGNLYPGFWYQYDDGTTDFDAQPVTVYLINIGTGTFSSLITRYAGICVGVHQADGVPIFAVAENGNSPASGPLPPIRGRRGEDGERGRRIPPYSYPGPTGPAGLMGPRGRKGQDGERGRRIPPSPAYGSGGSGSSLTTQYSDSSLVITPTSILQIVVNHGLVLTNPGGGGTAQLDLAAQLQTIYNLTTTQAGNLAYLVQNLNSTQIDSLVYLFANLSSTQVTNLYYVFDNLTYTELQNLIYVFQNLTYAQLTTFIYFFANITLTNTQITNLFYVFGNLTYSQLQSLVYFYVNVTLTNTQFSNLYYFFNSLTYTQLQLIVNVGTGSTSSLAGDVTGALGANTVGKLKGISLDATAGSPTDADILIYRATTGKWVPNPLSGDAVMTSLGVVTVQGLQGVAVGDVVPSPGYLLMFSEVSNAWIPVLLKGDVSVSSDIDGGTLGKVEVIGLYGVALSSTAPTTGQFLSYNGTVWIATTVLLWPCTTLGDLPYENGTPAPARLPGNTSTTKKFLTQTGTGSVSAAPAWGTIAAGDAPITGLVTAGTNITISGSGTLASPYVINSAGAVNPGAPTSLTVTGKASGQVSLSWTAPSGAPPAASYNVYYSTASNMASATLFGNTASTTSTVTGLTNNTLYYFAVTAIASGGGESGYSNIVSAEPSNHTFYDTFTDANGTALTAHTPDVRPNTNSWTNPNGTNSVESDQAQCTTAASSVYGNGGVSLFNTGLSNFSNLSAAFYYGSATGVQSSGLIFRATDYNDCFYCNIYEEGNSVTLYSISSGSATSLGSATVTPVSGGVLAVSAEGTTITVSYGGSTLFSVTSSLYESNTTVGFWLDGANAGNWTVDNFTQDS